MKTLNQEELTQIDGGIFSYLHYLWHGGDEEELIMCYSGDYHNQYDPFCG